MLTETDFKPYQLRRFKGGYKSGHLEVSASIFEDGEEVGELEVRGEHNDDVVVSFSDGAAGQKRYELFIRELVDTGAWANRLGPEIHALVEGGVMRPGKDLVATFMAAMIEVERQRQWLRDRCRHKTIFHLKSDPVTRWRAWDLPFSAEVAAELRTAKGHDLDLIGNEVALRQPAIAKGKTDAWRNA